MTMAKWVHNPTYGAIFDMLIYAHSISGKKHPGHDQDSHAEKARSLVTGSYLSSRSGTTGTVHLTGPISVIGGSMLANGSETALKTVRQLVKKSPNRTSYKDELSMEKNFGGA